MSIDGGAVTTSRPRRLQLLKALAVCFAVAVVVSQWVRVIGNPRGDFPFHYQFAQRFYAGETLYGSGEPIPSLQRQVDDHADNVPYPPFWAVAHGVALLLPLHAAQVVAYPLGILMALLLAAVCFAMISASEKPARAPPLGSADAPGPAREIWASIRANLTLNHRFWAIVLAVTLTGRFFVRDLTECLVNTSLVALTWLGIFLWARGRDVSGALALGAAIALKMTAALFVPYFLLKRQWKMAFWSTVFAGVLSIAPMLLRYGPASTLDQFGTWTTDIMKGIATRDPSMGILGEESYNNLALRPALGRYLMQFPDGHIGRAPSPYSIDILTLSPETADLVVRLLTAALVLFGAWAMRRPVTGRSDRGILWECAAISIAMLLLSPITWQHHAVGIFPAMLLISWSIVRRDRISAWVWGALGLFVLVTLILNRAVLGREGTALLLDYHLFTVAFLAVLGAVVHMRGRARLPVSEESPGRATHQLAG